MNKAAPTATAKRELLTAKISGKTKSQLKSLAALSGKTLSAYLEELIVEHCEAETKKQALKTSTEESDRSSSRSSWRNLLKN